MTDTIDTTEALSPDRHRGETGVLRTEHLVKRYRSRTVVNDVSIELRQGEIVGLLGPCLLYTSYNCSVRSYT